MKAWRVRKKDDFFASVVFAETRSKAKVLALSTECCEYADYIEIEAHRMPQADKYYKEGKWQLDWMDNQDRIALVKDCGFYCEYMELDWCEICAAKEYCDEYQDYLESEAQADDR